MTPEFNQGSGVYDYDSIDYSRLWKDKVIEDFAQKRVLQDILFPCETCLELGGGYGRVTSMLAGYSKRVVMIDLSKRGLELARSRLQDTMLIRGNILGLPLKENLFDLVVMVRVAHHIRNMIGLMSEVRRVLKPGGTLIISVPNIWANSLSHQTGKLFKRDSTPILRRNDYSGRPGGYFSPISEFVLPGFKLEKIKGTGLFDNFLGVRLTRHKWLHLIDYGTSWAWPFKTDIFLRFHVEK